MKGIVKTPHVIHHDPALVVDRSVILGVLKVTPVNIDLKTGDEQHALHRFYQQLLDTVSYPVYLHSRQSRTGLTDYIDQIRQAPGSSDLREAYINHCRTLEDRAIVETNHYITVHVYGRAHSSPGNTLLQRLEEIKSLLSGGELTIAQVTGDELWEFAKSAWNPSPEVSRRYCNVGSNSQEYRKLLYVDDYPAELDFGWPRHLLRTQGLVDITQVVQPVPVDTAVTKLRRQSEKLDAEIAAFLANGNRGTNRIERSLDDAEWFLDLLADQECMPVKYGVYITAHGDSRRETEATFQRLKSRLRTLRIKFKEPAFRNDYAHYTDSVFHRDRLNEKLLMPSLSVATGLPFGTQVFENKHGVLYGVDVEDETPVLLDRFNWDSHSMAVMGTLGSGKSYSAKLELLRSAVVYSDLRIIVVDPKQEYRSTVEALGGTHKKITGTKDYSFNEQVLGFEVRERGEHENVELLTDLVRQIYSAVSQNREPTLVLIDEARNLLEDEAGRHVLNQFVLEARDINTAVHLVSQSASHFTDWREGQDILNHVPAKLFFRHENVTDSMTDYFSFSLQKKSELRCLRNGGEAGASEALLHVSNIYDTKIRIESSPFEHRVIDSPQKPVQVIE